MKKDNFILIIFALIVIFSNQAFAELVFVNLTNPSGNLKINGSIILSAVFNATNVNDSIIATFYVYNLTDGSWMALCTNNTLNNTNPSFLTILTCSFDSTSVLDAANYTFNITLVSNNTAYSNANANITIDNHAPKVTFVSPLANFWSNSSFLVRADILDAITAKYRYENSSNGATSYSSWFDLNMLGNYWNAAWNATLNASLLAEGNYTLRINASDSLGNLNASENILFWIDRTPPVISFSLINSTFNIGDSVTSKLNCSAIDNLDSFVTIDRMHEGANSAGTKTATCIAIDNAGNAVKSTLSYTVNAAPTSDSGSTGNSEGASTSDSKSETSITTKLTDSQLKNGTSIYSTKNSKLEFVVNGQTHSIKIDSMNSTTKKVVLTIASSPQTVTMSENESKRFEITGDNYYDINLTILQIFVSSIRLSIKQINESVPITSTTASASNQTQQNATLSADINQTNANQTNETITKTRFGIIGSTIKNIANVKLFSTLGNTISIIKNKAIGIKLSLAWVLIVVVGVIVIAVLVVFFVLRVYKQRRYYKKGY